MKIRLTTDEMYPVYFELNYEWVKEYEIPEEVWNEYREAYSNFSEKLNKLEIYIDSSKT